MSWKKLQAEGRVRTHKASKKELNELRALIARDLEDAAIQQLSDDRRFATAYNAALQTAKMAIACAGFQLASAPGHPPAFDRACIDLLWFPELGQTHQFSEKFILAAISATHT